MNAQIDIEDTSIVSSRARIQTRAATVNLWYSTPAPAFSEHKSNNRPLCNKGVFFPVSGDIFPAVMYTVEHNIGQFKSSEHPNEAKSKPFGTNIYIVVQILPNSKNGTWLTLTWLAGSTFMC